MSSDPQEPEDFDSTIQLVSAAQDGDRSAMERLFTRYLPRVRQIVALRMGRRLGRFMETDDIAQEALLKAFNGLDRFEHKSEGSFRNWLARCVECEIKDQVRKVDAKKRGAGKVYRFGDCSSDILVSSIFAGSGPSPSQVVQAADLETEIEEALLAMPEHLREVIILRHLCDLSYDEIAETMGFNQVTTARKACSRALQKLKEQLRSA